MPSSLNIGKLFGIGIELHWSFLLLLALVLLVSGLDALFIIVILFTSVLLHELCHSIVAKRHRIPVSKIILLPIGGMSVIKQLPTNPHTEFKVAIAGPLFNFVVVVIALYLQLLFNTNPAWSILEIIKQANLALGAFNLFVPALPMDGGRIFRSLLAMHFGFLKATKIATKVSQILAVSVIIGSFVLASVFGNWGSAIWISFIAFIVFMAAQSEEAMANMQYALHGYTVKDAISKAPSLKASDSIEKAISLFKEYKVDAFPVIAKKPAILEMRDLGAKNSGKVSSVARLVTAVSPNESLFHASTKLTEQNVSMLPVYDKGKLVGVIYKGDIDFVIRFRQVNPSRK